MTKTTSAKMTWNGVCMILAMKREKTKNMKNGWYFVGKASKTSCESANTYLKPIRIKQLMGGGRFLNTDVFEFNISSSILILIMCSECCFGISIWNCMFYVLKDVNVICYFTMFLICCYDSCCHQRWVNLFLVVNKHEFGEHIKLPFACLEIGFQFV